MSDQHVSQWPLTDKTTAGGDDQPDCYFGCATIDNFVEKKPHLKILDPIRNEFSVFRVLTLLLWPLQLQQDLDVSHQP